MPLCGTWWDVAAAEPGLLHYPPPGCDWAAAEASRRPQKPQPPPPRTQSPWGPFYIRADEHLVDPSFALAGQGQRVQTLQKAEGLSQGTVCPARTTSSQGLAFGEGHEVRQPGIMAS